MHQGVGDHLEVLPVERRGEVGVGGALAPACRDVQIDPVEALLQAAADVDRTSETRLLGRGEAGLRHRVRVGRRADGQRAAPSAQCGIALRCVLAAPKIGQQVIKAPPRHRPDVVAGPMPAVEVHRVDRRRAAQRAPARPLHHRAGGRLRHRLVCPVRATARQGGPGRRHRHLGQRLAAAGLKHQHPRGGALAQPGGEHATRRARAHHNEVVSGLGYPLSHCPLSQSSE